ncbi:DUF537-domain-containing protein [Daedalea quercina L-15889]|uniref:DUF537-domain-containing protein n=1 Tax=Daedalea quercina L-15889 TaxID=1314783 RepID=A0A165MBN1_9APHY|nr:DUF537-domain-containing protein [Daedalea quercina L-15889]
MPMPLPPGPHISQRPLRSPLFYSPDSPVFMSDHEHVAIFWDYENCSPSCNMTGYDIVSNIREIAHTFGSVTLFKAYVDLSEQSPKSNTLRSELQSCGVSLTDCPHNGKKDVADKMMIVDMLTYALDTPAPATIVLISGDRDFVYAVSVLRLRRYRVVLVAPQTAHTSMRLQATVVLDWAADVLGKEKTSGLPTPGESTRSAHRRSQSSVNSAVIPASPFAAKSQRRLSFREAPQRPSIEPLQGTANPRSPRVPTTPLQAAWTPAEDRTHVTAGSSTSPLQPQGASQQGLPTFLSEPGSAPPELKPVPDESVDLVGSEDIADLNIHLKNLTSRTPSSSAPSPYISVTPVEDNNMSEREQAQQTTTGVQSNSPTTSEVANTCSSQVAGIAQRRTSLSPVEVKDLFRGGSVVSPAARIDTMQPLDASMPFTTAAVLEAAQADALRPASAPASVDPASCVDVEDGPSKDNSSCDDATHASGSATAQRERQATDDTISVPVVVWPSPTLSSRTPSTSHSSGSSLDADIAIAFSWLPPHFANLVRVMQELHAKSPKPELLRSAVAVLLSQRHRGQYNQAGFADFKAFSTAAEQRGLITMGGSQGGAWMKLEPEWFGCS